MKKAMRDKELKGKTKVHYLAEGTQACELPRETLLPAGGIPQLSLCAPHWKSSGLLQPNGSFTHLTQTESTQCIEDSTGGRQGPTALL